MKLYSLNSTVSGLQILLWTKVYIFSDSLLSDYHGYISEPPNIPSDHTKQFLDTTTNGDLPRSILKCRRVFTFIALQTTVDTFLNLIEIMSSTHEFFALAEALKPTVGGTSPAMLQLSDGSTCVIQLSLFTCLIIVSLFTVLTTVTTLALSFAFLQFSGQGTRQPQAPPRKSVMRHRRVMGQRPKTVIRHHVCRHLDPGSIHQSF